MTIIEISTAGACTQQTARVDEIGLNLFFGMTVKR